MIENVNKDYISLGFKCEHCGGHIFTTYIPHSRGYFFINAYRCLKSDVAYFIMFNKWKCKKCREMMSATILRILRSLVWVGAING